MYTCGCGLRKRCSVLEQQNVWLRFVDFVVFPSQALCTSLSA